MNDLKLNVEGYINPGNIVHVHFASSQSMYEAKVLERPTRAGESWRLQSRDGLVVYVQMFEKMILIR